MNLTCCALSHLGRCPTLILQIPRRTNNSRTNLLNAASSVHCPSIDSPHEWLRLAWYSIQMAIQESFTWIMSAVNLTFGVVFFIYPIQMDDHGFILQHATTWGISDTPSLHIDWSMAIFYSLCCSPSPQIYTWKGLLPLALPCLTRKSRTTQQIQIN